MLSAPKVFLLIITIFLLPQPTIAAGSVVINEIYPNPAGRSEADEFIELYNKGSKEIDISGWSIDDIVDGGSKPYFIAEGTILAPQDFIVFYRSESKIALNNTGDEVNLFDAEGKLVDQYIFAEVEEEIVLGRYPDGNNWFTLQASSAGTTNKPPLPTVTPTPTVTPIPPTPTPTSKPAKMPKPTQTPKSIQPSFLQVIGNKTTNTKPKFSFNRQSVASKTEDNKATNSWQQATVAGQQASATAAALVGMADDNDKSDKKKKSAIFVILGGVMITAAAGLFYKRRRIRLSLQQ